MPDVIAHRSDFKLHCRHCGGAFLEMVELLFHPCQQPARSKHGATRRGSGQRGRRGMSRAKTAEVSDA
jgi:hypothetical protein